MILWSLFALHLKPIRALKHGVLCWSTKKSDFLLLFFDGNVSTCLYEYFGFFGFVPKIGCKGLFFFVGNFYKLGINVKDTSSTHQGAPQYLLFVRYLS
jgi:hypothetical protein